ncbi:MAG: hypothetical protein DRP83_01910 [Planctomycetota bacterium]|nr:MAG: hypothetical protein DRP83_01910 [Planctomycetota bacterium]
MANDFNVSDPYMFKGMRDTAPHTNPYHTYSQVYSPRRLKELFKWCEYLFYNSAHIYAALRKFGEYPITEILYDTPNEALKVRHKNLLEKVIHVRELLIEMTLDKYVYGNAFLSMYQPFIRYLKCPKCKTLTNIQNLDYKYGYASLKFTYRCPACRTEVTATEKEIEDRKLSVSRRINFIRWDPKHMDIDFNPLTGASVYYYTIPQMLVDGVQKGHKFVIDSMPVGFLKAIKKKKQFKFAPGYIFHMKVGGPAGINPQWGLPPLLSTLQLFHYAAILRKANEAIALDHLTPFRIVHPAQQSGNADPVTTISLEEWKTKLKDHFKQWRVDPLHVMFAPIPIGMTQIGGQGRALLTLGEVQEAEKNIVAALGIPMEFLYGGLTKSGMEATLRLIENQLETHVNDLNDCMQWIDDSCSKFLGYAKLQVELAPFRMIDDQYQKQVMMQLYQSGMQMGRRIISDQTMAEQNSIDLDQEEERIKQEELDAVRRDAELQIEVKQLQNNMAKQIQMESQQTGGMGYDQQQIIGQADQIVQEWMSMDDGGRRSAMDSLLKEDLVLYSVAMMRWEQMTRGKGEQSQEGMM